MLIVMAMAMFKTDGGFHLPRTNFFLIYITVKCLLITGTSLLQTSGSSQELLVQNEKCKKIKEFIKKHITSVFIVIVIDFIVILT